MNCRRSRVDHAEDPSLFLTAPFPSFIVKQAANHHVTKLLIRRWGQNKAQSFAQDTNPSPHAGRTKRSAGLKKGSCIPQASNGQCGEPYKRKDHPGLWCRGAVLLQQTRVRRQPGSFGASQQPTTKHRHQLSQCPFPNLPPAHQA